MTGFQAAGRRFAFFHQIFLGSSGRFMFLLVPKLPIAFIAASLQPGMIPIVTSAKSIGD